MSVRDFNYEYDRLASDDFELAMEVFGVEAREAPDPGEYKNGRYPI